MEEFTEVLIEFFNNNKENLIKESADLLYHLNVMVIFRFHPKIFGKNCINEKIRLVLLRRKIEKMIYDDNNIFAKILRKEIPTELVLKIKHAIAFKDIAPRAPVHVLVIPKENI